MPPKKMTESVVDIPQPMNIGADQKNAAMGAYFMMFASWAIGLPLPFFGLIASIIYYFINRAQSPFVRFHAQQALLFHIPISVINAALVIWFFIALSFPKMLGTVLAVGAICTAVLNIVYVILSIIAALYAKHGRFIYFPLIGRMSYRSNFVRPARARTLPKNSPPEGL